MLTLYRSADPDRLAAAGERLVELACPALVVWGRHDIYISPRWAQAYAERLPNAGLVEVDGAGHWPWLDRPEVIARVTDFLDQGRDGALRRASTGIQSPKGGLTPWSVPNRPFTLSQPRAPPAGDGLVSSA
jgi:hypothetical protein